MTSTSNTKDYSAPLIIPVEAAVSAKYRGAFCEAKVTHREVHYLCKVQPSNSGPIHSVDEKHIRIIATSSDSGSPLDPNSDPHDQLCMGAVVEVRSHGDKSSWKGRIVDFRDKSLYHVEFDDGDTRTLRRSKLLLKGTRHYKEEESLDQLPLYNPEQFKNPVRRNQESGQLWTRQREQLDSKPSSSHNSKGISDAGNKNKKENESKHGPRKGSVNPNLVNKERLSSGSESRASSMSTRMQRRSGSRRATPENTPTKQSWLGQLVRLDTNSENGDNKGNSTPAKSGNGNNTPVSSKASPLSVNKNAALMQPLNNIGLVVLAAAEPSITLTSSQVLVRSFKDNKFHGMEMSQLVRVTRSDIVHLNAKKLVNLNAGNLEKVMWWLDCDQLPPKWDLDQLLGPKALENRSMSSSESECEEGNGGSSEDRDEDAKSESSDASLTIEEKDHLFAQLVSFMEARNTPINNTPTIANKDLDLCRLHQLVIRNGGCKTVTASMLWPMIYNKMDLPFTPGGTTRLEQAYKKFLLPYEETIKMFGTAGTQVLDRRRSSLAPSSATVPGSSGLPSSPSIESPTHATTQRTPLSSSSTTPAPASSTNSANRFAIPQPTQQSSKSSKKESGNTSSNSSGGGGFESSSLLSSTPSAPLAKPLLQVLSHSAKISKKLRLNQIDTSLSGSDAERSVSTTPMKVIESSLSVVTGSGPQEVNMCTLSDTGIVESSALLPVGTNVKVKHDKQTFLAKIINQRLVGSQVLYRVHFRGYNSRHDEDVTVDKIIEVVSDSPCASTKPGNRQIPVSLSEASEGEDEGPGDTSSVSGISATSSSRRTRVYSGTTKMVQRKAATRHHYHHHRQNMTTAAASPTPSSSRSEEPVTTSKVGKGSGKKLANDRLTSPRHDGSALVNPSLESAAALSSNPMILGSPPSSISSKLSDSSKLLSGSKSEESGSHHQFAASSPSAGSNKTLKRKISSVEKEPGSGKKSKLQDSKSGLGSPDSQRRTSTVGGSPPPALKVDSPHTPDSKCSTLCEYPDEAGPEIELMKTPPQTFRRRGESGPSRNASGNAATAVTSTPDSPLTDLAVAPLSPEMPQIDDSRMLEAPSCYVKSSLAPTLSNPVEMSISPAKSSRSARYRNFRASRATAAASSATTRSESAKQHRPYPPSESSAEEEDEEQEDEDEEEEADGSSLTPSSPIRDSEAEEKHSPSPPVLKRVLSRASTPDTLPMNESAELLLLTPKTSPSRGGNTILEDAMETNVCETSLPEHAPFPPRGSVTRSSARRSGLVGGDVLQGPEGLANSSSVSGGLIFPSSMASRLAQVKVPFQWPLDRPYVFPYAELLPTQDYLNSLSQDERIKEMEKVMQALNEAWRNEKKRVREIESSADYKRMKKRLLNLSSAANQPPSRPQET